jgi:hypothetical protein
VLRNFDPHYPPGPSALEAAFLILGRALLGDTECADKICALFDNEEKAAREEGRAPRHDDYVRAWREDARLALLAEGITRPTKRDVRRKRGLVREGARGNAPKRLEMLRTFAMVEREHRKNPGTFRSVAKSAVAAGLQDGKGLRKGAADKVKTVECHQTRAKKTLAIERQLEAVTTIQELNDCSPEAIDQSNLELAAFKRAAVALLCLSDLSSGTMALLERARTLGLIE